MKLQILEKISTVNDTCNIFTYLDKGEKYIAYLIKENEEFVCYLTIKLNVKQLALLKSNKISYITMISQNDAPLILKKFFKNQQKLPIIKEIDKEKVSQYLI